MAQQEKNYTTKKVKYSNFDILLELKKYPHPKIKVEHLKYIHDFGTNAEYWYGKGNLRLTASSLRLLGEDLICIILNIENLDSEDLLNFTGKQELQSVELEAMLRFFKQRTNLPKEVISDLYVIKNTGNEGTHFHSAQNLTQDSVKQSLLKAHEFVFAFFREYSTKQMAAFEKTPKFIFPNNKGEVWKEIRVYDNQENQQVNESCVQKSSKLEKENHQSVQNREAKTQDIKKSVQENNKYNQDDVKKSSTSEREYHQAAQNREMKTQKTSKSMDYGERYYLLAKECYKIGNYSEAFTLYQKAAEQGHISAQYHLGMCYYDGEGSEINCEEAVRWFRKAAEQGHTDAQYMFGFCYDMGSGIEQNHEEAFKWHRKAAEQGHADAYWVLLMIMVRELKKIIKRHLNGIKKLPNKETVMLNII